MKKNILLIVLLSSVLAFSQVGIDTQNPQAKFHVDGAKDNAVTGVPTAAQQANDVVITSAGNIGVGTVTPANKLTVTGGKIQYTDGTEANNYVLSTNASGVASWKPVALTLSPGVLGTGIDIPSTQTGIYYNTGSYIDLPPGKWMVTCIMLGSKRNSITGTGSEMTAPNETWWLRTTFGDANSPTSATQPSSPDIMGTSKLISGVLVASSYYSLLNSSVIINNTSGAVKRYYYYAGGISASTVNATGNLRDFGGIAYGENNIYYQAIY
ncbi:hypothetical protein HNP24_000091 [Chryseobacterium sediminis]|uniref:T9SS C-terminal target domain-containing protein n=1 Tax=Chryseobacterium sediminis TaxID=1679494 RepID=A0ABR6PTX4_9FLAO|nr:hypothetical protein [Chryseobacterium sediminis]MBB6329141.1 hypothetical protein [Chryseobacterium sediminis]